MWRVGCAPGMEESTASADGDAPPRSRIENDKKSFDSFVLEMRENALT
ncbi:Os06g0500100 [Oryza sativa Japonica Group]|uniref:Os06g0500100 protein n=2 Tax=Oryza sativa subsp. japonica TaxID=39947 RepID=Q0DC03_ORYSJ|nr:hypothetical protein EE612_034385 [Oryza sativa]BAF19620.2 Os06g0500000 [Oryza sativa Japonica Group]BAH01102.1 unnamed protein product [Oryza sativa Japonica Group]BAS97923.1 Os06g0500100 [Oryza sativa Japonica Group]|eukprot:NP_001057706.2 Os06g0500000 [Oryza sativa Japonica Group]